MAAQGGFNDAVKYHLTGMYQDWFLDYASYVILERAVPAIEGRFVFGFIDGLLGSDLCAQDDGAFAMPVINTIEHLLQACIFGAVFGVKQIGHNSRLGDDFEEHDPGLLIEDPGTESTTESSQGIGEQFLGIGRSDRERDQFGEVMLLDVGAKSGGMGIDVELLRDGMLNAELPRTMGTEIRDLLFEKHGIRDSCSKRTGGGNGLLHRQFRNINHILSAQFLPSQQTGFMEHFLRKSGRSLGELQCGSDPDLEQLGFSFPSYSPYIADLERGESLDALLFRPYLAHTVIARVFLGVLGRHFSECFGGGNTDGDRNPHPTPDLFDELLTVGFLSVSRDMVDIEKALVDRVLLKAGSVLADERHDPVRQIAVE